MENEKRKMKNGFENILTFNFEPSFIFHFSLISVLVVKSYN